MKKPGMSRLFLWCMEVSTLTIILARMSENASSSGSRPKLLLLGILILGASLRFYQIGFGLPDFVGVDTCNFVCTASLIATTGEYAPTSFQYPGLFTNSLALVYEVLGIESKWASYLAARILVALTGVLTIILTWQLASNVLGRNGAVISAALVAVCPVLVTYSREAYTDVPLTMFVTASALVLFSTHPFRRRMVICGAMIGLAGGIKYSGMFAALLPVIAVTLAVFRKELELRESLTGLTIAGVTSLLIFLITTPFFIALLTEYLDSIAFESHIQSHGQIGRVQLGYWDYLLSTTPTWEKPWLSTSILGNHGPIVVLCAAGGLFHSLFARRSGPVAQLGLFLLCYIAVFSHAGNIKAIRFLAPVLPILFIQAASFVDSLRLRWTFMDSRGIGGIALVILMAFPTWKSFVLVQSYSGPSTHEVAQSWLQENVKDGAVVVLSPLLPEEIASPQFRTMNIPGANILQYNPDPHRGQSVERNPVFNGDLVPAMIEAGAQYFVTNSYYQAGFAPITENLRWFPRATAAYLDFESRLSQHSELVFSVKGLEARRMGPDIEIYMFRN